MSSETDSSWPQLSASDPAKREQLTRTHEDTCAPHAFRDGVCMCTCVCAFVCMCVRACVRVCVCCMVARIRACVCICACKRLCVRACVRVYVWSQPAGGVSVGQGNEAELGGAIEDEVLGEAAHVEHDHARREQKLKNEVSVAHLYKSGRGWG